MIITGTLTAHISNSSIKVGFVKAGELIKKIDASSKAM
jgi:hypothetical protein